MTQGTTVPAGRATRYYVVALLFVIYTLSFVDRQIIGILATPIKAELHLTDTELGVMSGLSFALFYAVLGVPIAWIADRWSRTWLITLSLTAWSGFTALCGAAGSFWSMFAARVGVGVGEAGGVAPSYALIADYFPPAQRARAVAFFAIGAPVGAGLGVFLGGAVASAFNWRYAFVVAGVIGIVVAPLFRLTVREPLRGGMDEAAPVEDMLPLLTTCKRLLSKGSFWALSVGGSCSAAVNLGLGFWLPSFFQRSRGFTLGEASVYFGSILVIGGIGGLLTGGFLADRYGARAHKYYASIPAICVLLAAPVYAVAVTAPPSPWLFVLFIIGQMLNNSWLSSVMTAMQNLGPARTRTISAALLIFVNTVLGAGFGTVFFGAVSDLLKAHYGAESLRYSILCGLGLLVVSAGLFAMAASRLKRDWHKA